MVPWRPHGDTNMRRILENILLAIAVIISGEVASGGERIDGFGE